MISYDRLYERLFFWSNIYEASHAIMKGDRIKRIMKKRHWDAGTVMSYLPEWLEHPEIYLNVVHEPTYRWDKTGNKLRTIFVPTLEELAVQHAVVQVLWPVITHGAFENAFGAIPKRGPCDAKKRIEKWIQKDPAGCKNCSQSDIYHYYASIDRDRMFYICQKHIKDLRFLNILHYLIYSPSADEGLLLGNYSSGPLSMWYLQDFDHFVAQVLKPRHYIRWTDDIIAFDSNIKRLKRITEGMNAYLNTIRLRLKPNYKVFRFSYIKRDGTEGGRPLDFMGFKFYRNKTVLRKSIK